MGDSLNIKFVWTSRFGGELKFGNVKMLVGSVFGQRSLNFGYGESFRLWSRGRRASRSYSLTKGCVLERVRRVDPIFRRCRPISVMWRSNEYIRPLRCCLLVGRLLSSEVAGLRVPLVLESPTHEEETNTMKKALVLSAFLIALFPLSALAQVRTLVTFDGESGSCPSPAPWERGPRPTP